MRISMLAVMVVLAVAGVARAGEDGDAEQAKRAAAVQLHDAELAMVAAKDAPPGQADEAWTAAGNQFVVAVEGARLLDRADEALFNAAWCFARGKTIGGALTALQILRDQFPRSPLAAKALLMTGQLEAAIAYYDRAASTFADYATRYPKEVEAPDALENAARLHAAVGDDERAVREVERFVKLYGAKQPERAAALVASMAIDADEAGDAEGAAALYARYLAIAKADRPERTLAIMVRAAALQWRTSCPLPQLTAGLCARFDRRRGALIAVARTKPPAEAAIAAFEAVQHRAGGGSAPAELAGPLAEAQLHLAERGVEAVLALPAMPSIRRGSAAEAKQLEGWIVAWQRATHDAEQPLLDLASRHVRVSIAAAARIAVLADASAEQAAATAGLDDLAPALAARARDAALACLALSTALSAVGDDVATCEQILVRREPLDFPPRRERLTAPAGFIPPPAPEP